MPLPAISPQILSGIAGQNQNYAQPFAQGRLAGLQLQQGQQALQQGEQQINQAEREQALNKLADFNAVYGNVRDQSSLDVVNQSLEGTGFTNLYPRMDVFDQQFQQVQELSRNLAAKAPEKAGDFMKEERKTASDAVKSIDKRVGDIRSSFDKVKGLHATAKTSRQAAAGMVMNVARLISPGVVTDTDFRVLSGAADPVAAALALITGRDDGIGQALQAYYDPTNPESFNADALLQVAKDVSTAESSTLFDQYDDASARAQRASMPEEQFNTIFGGANKNIEGLRNIVTTELQTGSTPQPQTQAQPQEQPLNEDEKLELERLKQKYGR